jgi:hypothetical protein
VSVAVIELLEMVDVEHQQRQRLAVPPRAPPFHVGGIV